MADRILVLREGRIAAEFSRHEADEASIMRAATGQPATGRGRPNNDGTRHRLGGAAGATGARLATVVFPRP